MRRAKAVVLVVALTMLSVVGCGALIGLETTTTVEPDQEAAEATAALPDAGFSDVEEPTDGEVTEASMEACAPAGRVSPTKAELVLKTCGAADLVLVADEQSVGLDDDPEATVNTLFDTKYVTGCVGLAFTGGPFRALTVRARSRNGVCGNPCASTGCGTGHWFGLFVRKGAGHVWLATTTITTVYDDYTVTLPPSVGVNPYLYVCRSSANRTRDDVEVDYVAACP
jgi:hypothetical protein